MHQAMTNYTLKIYALLRTYGTLVYEQIMDCRFQLLTLSVISLEDGGVCVADMSLR